MFKSAEERGAERQKREAEQAREQAATAVSGVTVGVYLFRNTGS